MVTDQNTIKNYGSAAKLQLYFYILQALIGRLTGGC